MTTIILKGGVKVWVDFELDHGKCRGCHKKIWWASTENGKKMPICQDKDGAYISHFTDCPKAKFFRKGRGYILPDDLDYVPRTNGIETDEKELPKI